MASGNVLPSQGPVGEGNDRGRGDKERFSILQGQAHIWGKVNVTLN